MNNKDTQNAKEANIVENNQQNEIDDDDEFCGFEEAEPSTSI